MRLTYPVSVRPTSYAFFMEAATTLPFSQVRVRGELLLIDGLAIDDPCAVRLAKAHADPSRFATEAIEIGARVLDREQTGANADFVRAEFERAARELDGEFSERAHAVVERMDAKIAEVFGPESGHVTKLMERHFDDQSAGAVQNRVRAMLTEAATKMREDLQRQFTSDSDNNPLAGFQRASLAVIKHTSDQQAAHLRAMSDKLAELRTEVAELRSEREAGAVLEAERERGTAKGRTYEEAVAEAIDGLACARGDDCEAVGDLRGEGGRKGDVLVAIDGAAGPARGRVVFEAKASKLSRNEAMAQLDGALQTRGAQFAVLIVPCDEKLPARTLPLREYGGDKLLVSYDPQDGSTLALEVAYSLARARVLMARSQADGVDPTALLAELDRARGAMEDVRRIKTHLTNASTGVEQARALLDGMAAGVRAHLDQIAALLEVGPG
ncbi:MAG: hypothetical protein NVS1B9_09720 [Solirubrobacteraceae bacterium]